MTTENATDTHDGAPRRSKRFGLVALVLAAIAGAVIAALAVTLLGRPSAPSTPTSAAPVATATTAAEVKERWQCPMHPSVVMDHPGKCPICGMELVKMEGGAGASDAGEAPGTGELATVTIDPARQQLIGLRTEEATHGPVGGRWRTNGRVAIDETRVRHVNLKVGGFVERVFVDFVGKTVSKGQPLFAMYSPELYAAQAEYLLALETKKRLAEGGALAGNGDELLRSARKKLELWDVSKADIDRLEATGEASRTLTLYAPISGVVVKKDVVEGMRLEAGAMPYEIVDLSVVWVLADVYERELANVKVGMPATLALKALPNRAFEGQVLFMDPLLDPATRTVKVRLAFPNRTGELRPEMFGEVTLQSSPRHALRIPADAVVDSGTRSIVFVALGAGKFAPREVELGADDGTFVE
ncbi:efflux RND transporter periplasmic adaptor subunit, partial [Myxococcota bacterium]|nr:efflux RND transporter periplasmic adaptor subunit [Myxococcota bacterium]